MQRSSSKTHLLLALGVAAIVLPLAVVGVRSATNPWATIEGLTDDMAADLASRNDTRPALHGPTTGANAWDHYQLAARELEARLPIVGEERLRLASTSFDAAGATLRRGLQRDLREVLRQLRLGAQAGDTSWVLGRRPHDKGPKIRGVHAEWLARSTVAVGARLLEQGDAEEAARVLLDGVQFSRDFMFVPRTIYALKGQEIFPPPGLLDLMASTEGQAHSPDAVSVLVDGLAAVDRSLDRARPWALREAYRQSTILAWNRTQGRSVRDAVDHMVDESPWVDWRPLERDAVLYLRRAMEEAQRLESAQVSRVGAAAVARDLELGYGDAGPFDKAMKPPYVYVEGGFARTRKKLDALRRGLELGFPDAGGQGR